MVEKRNRNQIIFVNSFKGGAGKTTLALTHCIDELFHECRFENVIYIDLDILGTATSYLFDKDKLPLDKCFNHTKKEEKILLTNEGESKNLNVLYLSPELKMRSAYGGLNYINHQELAQQRLRDDILAYVGKIVGRQGKNLIVFDCAPGFSKMEQELLRVCYDLQSHKKAEVREEYVTTLDAGHIEKCIQCIRDSWETFRIPPAFRKIRLTLNDIQNYYRYVSEDPKTDVEQKLLEMAKSVFTRLKTDDGANQIEIYYWQYSQEIAMQSIYLHQQYVENQIDRFILTKDSYKQIYSDERQPQTDLF